MIVETALGKDLPYVAGNRIQLQQALLSLSAVEAMDQVTDRPKRLAIPSAQESVVCFTIPPKSSGAQ